MTNGKSQGKTQYIVFFMVRYTISRGSSDVVIFRKISAIYLFSFFLEASLSCNSLIPAIRAMMPPNTSIAGRVPLRTVTKSPRHPTRAHNPMIATAAPIIILRYFPINFSFISGEKNFTTGVSSMQEKNGAITSSFLSSIFPSH